MGEREGREREEDESPLFVSPLFHERERVRKGDNQRGEREREREREREKRGKRESDNSVNRVPFEFFFAESRTSLIRKATFLHCFYCPLSAPCLSKERVQNLGEEERGGDKKEEEKIRLGVHFIFLCFLSSFCLLCFLFSFRLLCVCPKTRQLQIMIIKYGSCCSTGSGSGGDREEAARWRPEEETRGK